MDNLNVPIKTTTKNTTETTETTERNGRLCNQLIRNLCVSLIAEKHDLHVKYSSYDRITALGIPLYVGKNTYNNTIKLSDDNFFDILNAISFTSNLNPNENYFQTKDITNHLYKYLSQEPVKQHVISMNPFKSRYQNNNDCFIHIRLTDCERYNPGLQYYLNVLEQNVFDNLYIASDDISHPLIQNIASKYSNSKIVNCDEIKTIQFGSTNKYVILSHGSYSAAIGYLSFYSQIYYQKYQENKIWYGDMFSIPGWREIE